MECEPAFAYGTERPGGSSRGPPPRPHDGPRAEPKIRLDKRHEPRGRGHRAARPSPLADGDQRFCALTWSESPVAPTHDRGGVARLERTGDFWRRWLGHGDFPDHPWRVHLQRSALTLKGLTYAPTGAASPRATTSLPETPGRRAQLGLPLHLDPRRDLHAVVAARARLRRGGARLRAVHRRHRHAARTTRLQIMYGIGGESDLHRVDARPLWRLRRRQPVRIGNGAFAQRQNDVSGRCWTRSTSTQGRQPHSRASLGVRRGPGRAGLRGLEPSPTGDLGGAGRAEALRLVEADVLGGARPRRADGQRRRRERRAAEQWADRRPDPADILERGVNERGVFRQHYDTDALDASTLLVPLVRFLPPDDERVRDTVLAIAKELTEQGLVLRYRVDETDDGLTGVEGTFTICSFWLVSALSEIGEARARPGAVRAAARLRRSRSASTRRRSSRQRAPPRATSRRRSRTWR